MTYRTMPGRPPQDPWAEGLYVRDWQAWLDDDGARFAWILDEDRRVGALRWLEDEVTQVLGVGAPEPPVEASEYGLMWLKPRVIHAYSFQPGLIEVAHRQGLSLESQVFQLRARLEGPYQPADDVKPITAQYAETAGGIYDQVFRTKGGRRLVWQYFQQFNTLTAFLLHHQGRPIGLYADRLNPTGEAAVVWLGILSDFRQKGFGRRLLEAGLAHRQRGGVRQAVVQLEASNSPALRLYEPFGFAWEWTKTRAEIT